MNLLSPALFSTSGPRRDLIVAVKGRLRRLRYAPVETCTWLWRRRALRSGYRRLVTALVKRGRISPRRIPVEDLLLGDQGGILAGDFFSAWGHPEWASLQEVRWPHSLCGRPIVSYEELAREVIRQKGTFFGLDANSDLAGLDPGDRVGVDVPYESLAPILVRRVYKSQRFQLVDGHHRVARAASQGAQAVAAVILRGRVLTPIQRAVIDMSWTEARPLVYQPIPAPELSSWQQVRQCTDRLDLMLDHLTARGISTRGLSYADYASNYGWFVAQMLARGADAYGIERDTRAQAVGRIFYGIEQARILVNDVLAAGSHARSFDVISCFSLAHHYVLQRQEEKARQLLASLYASSRRGVFFEMGHGSELWYRNTALAGWTNAYIEEWLRSQFPSATVTMLGVDRDCSGAYRNMYGRAMFAIWRPT